MAMLPLFLVLWFFARSGTEPCALRGILVWDSTGTASFVEIISSASGLAGLLFSLLSFFFVAKVDVGGWLGKGGNGLLKVHDLLIRCSDLLCFVWLWFSSFGVFAFIVRLCMS